MKLIGATEGRESQRTRRHAETKRNSIKDDLAEDFEQIGAAYLSPKKPPQGKAGGNPRD